MGGTPEVALAGALAMRAVSLGHSGFPLDGARALLDELGADATLPEAGAWADALRASPLIAADTDASAPLVFEHGMVALRRYARYAQRLARSEEHTSELQSLMRISYDVFHLNNNKT